MTNPHSIFHSALGVCGSENDCYGCVGAITGSLTSFGVIKVINGFGAEQENVTIDEPAQHLPLSSCLLRQRE